MQRMRELNMESKNYLATQPHTREYPAPIIFSRETLLAIGERYAGRQGWDDWFF